jgi:hypothetical protein
MKSLEKISDRSNPLSEFISDEIFIILNVRGLINEKSLRDYEIRRRFKELRADKLRVSQAIDTLQKEYPYLQYDTIRKIVYNIQ